MPNSHNEIHYVAEEVVRCDGSGAVDSIFFGHPAIFLHLNQEHKAKCPYCGRIFIMRNIDNNYGW